MVAVTPNARRSRSDPADALRTDYLKRAGQYALCEYEIFSEEAALLTSIERRIARVAAALILCDSSGRSLSSKAFAGHLEKLRDSGVQQVVTAIGPPDGWSPRARQRADLLLSLGPMTLPHTLAQAVLAEQIYRALTILAGHPYHCGH